MNDYPVVYPPLQLERAMMNKSWDTLTTDEQNLYLTLLWEDGHSEKAIADFLQTTKGRIVRRRQSVLQLPTGSRDRMSIKQKVDPTRFDDLLDLHAMAKIEEEGVIAFSIPLRGNDVVEKAPHEETCWWPLASSTNLKPVFCCEPAVPGHKLCEEHRAIALGRKK